MQQTITLRQVWRDYADAHPTLKNKTLRDANCKLKNVSDWMDLDLRLINKEMIIDRHKQMSVKAPVQANHAFRLINRLISFAIYRYENEDGLPLIERNPVQYLNQARAWNKERARTRHIPLHRIQDWFSAVLLLPYPTIRDYLIVCLLTGMRSTEVASLKWEYLDWDGGFINLPETKNGEAHCLPMSTYLRILFEERYQNRINHFVFPGGSGRGRRGRPPHVQKMQMGCALYCAGLNKTEISRQLNVERKLITLWSQRGMWDLKRQEQQTMPSDKTFDGNTNELDRPAGYMASPAKGIALVVERTGIKFSSHDLRRTFNLLAEDIDIDEYTRKRLLNHTMQDVTGKHYSIKNPEKLRKPMERISQHALSLAGFLRAEVQ